MDDQRDVGLGFVHLNKGSLLANNKLDMLKLNLQTEKFDLICLSETWLNEAIPNNFIKIDGYNILRR